jgi:hypothetical protein
MEEEKEEEGTGVVAASTILPHFTVFGNHRD